MLLSTLVLAGTARGTALDLRSVASLGVFSVAFSAQGGSGAADLQGGASTLPTPNAYLYVSGRVTVDGALGHGTLRTGVLKRFETPKPAEPIRRRARRKHGVRTAMNQAIERLARILDVDIEPGSSSGKNQALEPACTIPLPHRELGSRT